MIALTMLSVGILATSGLFVTGQVTLKRAAQNDTAAVLADRMLERFRAITWNNIALSGTLVAAADSTYTSDAALSGTSDLTDANGPVASANACASPTPLTCYPSRSIPDVTHSETAPDHLSYRIDTLRHLGLPRRQLAGRLHLGADLLVELLLAREGRDDRDPRLRRRGDLPGPRRASTACRAARCPR